MANSLKIKLVGEAEIPEAIDLDKDYLISVDATVTDINKKSDDAGGFIYSHKLKIRTVEILKLNGEIIKARVKGSESQKTRWAILGIRNEVNPEMDDEAFYESVQQQLRRYLPEVIEFMKGLENG